MVAAVIAGAALGGCAGPNQAGSAVIVGETAVPLQQVQSQLAAALGRVPADQRRPEQDVTFARSIVTNQVLHGLLVREAAPAGIVIDDATVDAFIEQQGGAPALIQSTGLDEAMLRTQVRDYLTAVELGRRAAPGLAVTVDILGATSREDAEAKAHTLAAGGPAADALFADPRTALRDQQVAAVTYPINPGTPGADVRSVLFGTGVGEVVAYQPDPQQSTWNVFRVTQRRTDALPADPAAAGKLSQGELYLIGQRTLQPLATSLGVRVNPRYGVWDPISLSVVPAGQTAGIVLPAPAAPPA